MRCFLRLKEQYPVTAHAPNFDFRTGCGEIKRCGESKRTLKNPFALRLTEFDITLKRLRITDQWYIVPVKFRFGRNRDFFALLLLPLAGGPKGGKHFDADWTDWRLISFASFHRSSDNCERNTRKWNSNNKGCKKQTIETLILTSYTSLIRKAVFKARGTRFSGRDSALLATISRWVFVPRAKFWRRRKTSSKV